MFWIRPLLLCFCVLTSYQVNAAVVSDVDVAEQITVSPSETKLHLNGAALRKMYFLVDVYVGGLYLEETSQDPDIIIASNTYKRMMFHVLLKRVSARRIANALNEALIINLTKDEHESLKPTIDRFLSLFDNRRFHKGDEAILDYLPGKGTLVRIPGREDTLLEGKAFYDALLKVWIGLQPVSNDFKAQILGFLDED